MLPNSVRKVLFVCWKNACAYPWIFADLFQRI